MKLFELRRIEDESGVSGTGTVAQGVVFDNGWCSLTWLTQHTSVAFYTSIDEVVAIHGHNGKTRVVQTADCDAKTVTHLCNNWAQDQWENIVGEFMKGNPRHVWDQRNKLVSLFFEKPLDGAKEPTP